ncbi:MAG TPA: OsmC family protein [Longimicrobiales bacterium]
MRILLDGGQALRVQTAGSGLEIASTDPAVGFSPLHMLAASLATCTVAALAAWAGSAGLDLTELEIGIRWEYVEDPYRVGRYELTVRWPALPESRRTAALRVARRCTVEHTLQHPPAIDIRLAA